MITLDRSKTDHIRLSTLHNCSRERATNLHRHQRCLCPRSHNPARTIGQTFLHTARFLNRHCIASHILHNRSVYTDQTMYRRSLIGDGFVSHARSVSTSFIYCHKPIVYPTESLFLHSAPQCIARYIFFSTSLRQNPSTSNRGSSIRLQHQSTQ